MASGLLDDDPRPVKRCVCADMSFEEMKRQGVASVEDAQRRFGAGTQCKRCLVYIRRMAETGDTEFPVFGTSSA